MAQVDTDTQVYEDFEWKNPWILDHSVRSKEENS